VFDVSEVWMNLNRLFFFYLNTQIFLSSLWSSFESICVVKSAIEINLTWFTHTHTHTQGWTCWTGWSASGQRCKINCAGSESFKRGNNYTLKLISLCWSCATANHTHTHTHTECMRSGCRKQIHWQQINHSV